MMNLDDVITFVEKPSSELYSLKVKSGPFTGVIYTYGKVQVRENKKQDNAKVKFKFHIELAPPGFTIKQLEEDKDFKNFMGDVLIELIEEKMYNDQSTTDNT